MPQVVVRAIPERLDVKKSGWPRKKPIRVHYEVLIDGKSRWKAKTDYEAEPTVTKRRIEEAKKTLIQWGTDLANYEKAMAEFAQLGFEETVPV